ncbi:MAG: carboxymuconolactone decarboxylase family protein [Pseudomonadota bacterium]
MDTTDRPLRSKLQRHKKEAISLFKAAPEQMRAFNTLMVAASKDGVVSTRHKELTALAIAIAMRCEGCILHHVDAARRHGAQREEVVEIICVAVEMGGGPATVYGATALAAFDEGSPA